jgi:hypothetical protein
VKPYWQSPDGRTTIYHAPWEAVVAAGCVPLSEVALIHGDPTYGNGKDAHRGDAVEYVQKSATKSGVQRVWAPLAGNDKPFDPAPLLALDRPAVLWGANHYASRLPDSKAWLVWDKSDGTTSNTYSDCELAWCSFGGSIRQFRHVWKGLARESENGIPHLYPTQKPIKLSVFVFQHAKLKPGDLVFVPCLGSGPDVAAAHQMGLRIIGCDVSKEACDLSVSRLRSITPERNAEPAGPLFVGLH